MSGYKYETKQTIATYIGGNNENIEVYNIMRKSDEFNTLMYDYTNLKKYIDMEEVYVVDMRSTSGNYINTLMIEDEYGEEEIKEDRKKEAFENTLELFSLLTVNGERLIGWEENLIGEQIQKLYNEKGVTGNHSTWGNSTECTYVGVYRGLEEYVRKAMKENEKDTNKLLDMIIKLKPYFEQGGIRNHWFKNQINMDEVLNRKNIVILIDKETEDTTVCKEHAMKVSKFYAYCIAEKFKRRCAEENKKIIVFENS